MAIAGLGGAGRHALEALRRDSSVRLVGVSDRDPAAIAEAGIPDLPTFTDHRSCLAQTRPDIVFIALPPAPAGELIETCAQRHAHVIKAPPLARTVSEAAALVRTMEAAQLKFAVATHRRFVPSYRKAFELRHAVGPLQLARAHYLFNYGDVLGWRADRELAGGGALLELGYHLIDLLIWMHGLPEDVFGGCAARATPDLSDPNTVHTPPSSTEDSAAAVLRSADGAMMSLVVSRVSGPWSERLCLHGPEGSLTVDPHECLLFRPDGAVAERSESFGDPVAHVQQLIESVVQDICHEGPATTCSAREDLLTMAVVEAMYLSEKTASTEHPQTILWAAGLQPQDCLTHRRPEAD